MAVARDTPHLPTSIDLSSLSHSELLSLSLLTTTTTTSSSNDTVSTTTHLHHFNQSTSSHKQTFSHHHRRRRTRRRGILTADRSDFNSIVNFLKHYLLFQFDDSNTANAVEIVNKNGVVVDLAALKDDDGGPYGVELRRMAAGVDNEEELLKMLGSMKGSWCSRRRKRRVVEACLLGDALPLGWRLIIALRRKAGRFFPYCRCYLSPTGEQFASCKEVSSYLQSHFEMNGASLVKGARGESCMNSLESSLVDVSISAAPDSSALMGHGKDLSALGIDNLPEVQVSDLYECHACKVSFHEKGKYLQHLLSFHQRTTRRYQLGLSVGERVCIKEGKYRCGLCSEVFEEKTRFLEHVGDHVKGSVRQSKDLSVAMLERATLHRVDQLPNPTGISPMDAFIEVSQSSIEEISPSIPEKEPESVITRDEPSKNSRVGVVNSVSGKNSVSCLHDLEMENRSVEVSISSQKLNSCDKLSAISSACSNKTEAEKTNGKDETLSVVSNPTHCETGVILMTDGAINDSSACSVEYEVMPNQDTIKELNPCVQVIAISEADRYKVDSTVNEPEMKKDSRKRNSVFAEWNPHDNMDDILMTDIETNNSYSDPMTLAAAKSGLPDLIASMSNVSSTKNEESAIECTLDPEHAKKYDDRGLAFLSGDNQTAINSSSSIEEPSGKQAGHYMCGHDQNHGSEPGTEHMELDDIEPLMYNTRKGDSISLAEVTMAMETSTGVRMELHSTIDFPAEIPVGTGHEGPTTTFCVWCGIEFCHEVADIELQPDSVGFMCPTCRNKISNQFNELESHFSLDPHCV